MKTRPDPCWGCGWQDEGMECSCMAHEQWEEESRKDVERDAEE